MLADDQHIGFNSGVVKLLLENTAADIVVLAEARQCARIEAELDAAQADRVVLHARMVTMPADDERVMYALSLAWNYLRSFLFVMRRAPDAVFYMTVDYTVFPPMSWFFRLWGRKVNVMIHQSPPLTRARGLKRRILFRWLAIPALRFFVPTHSTAAEIGAKYPGTRFETLRYPLMFQAHARTRKAADEIVVSLIGKQSSLLSDAQLGTLIRHVESANASGRGVAVRLILAVEDLPVEPQDHVTYVSRSRLARQDYVDCIAASHFVLFIGDDQRPPRASGVAMDSVALDAAIVAPLKGAYADVRQLTDQDFGYLFDPALSFEEVAGHFFGTHIWQYERYKAGCQRLKERVAQVNAALPSSMVHFR